MCLPYSQQVSKPTGLWQIQNCCFFEGGILPPKKETDSKTINALLSVWIFCFPSVGHLLYGCFFSADLKDASFFESILSKNERKIVPKTAFRLNLQVSKTVAHFFVPKECVSDLLGRHITIPINNFLIGFVNAYSDLSNIRLAFCATMLLPDILPRLTFHNFSSTSNLQLNWEILPFMVMRHITGTSPFFFVALRLR